MFTISEVSPRSSYYVTGFASNFQHICFQLSNDNFASISHVTLLAAYNQMNSSDFVT